MIVAGIDFETNSVDAHNTHITEVGIIVYDVTDGLTGKKFASWREVDRFSSFCWEPEYPPQSPMIVELTGITDAMLKANGLPRKQVFKNHILPMVAEADLMVAHNEGFDRVVLESTAKLLGINLPQKEWLCTLRNFPWPKKFTCHKLPHLAWEHDLGLAPSDFHRAINDVEAMFRLIAAYDFNEVLTYAREAWVYLKADCCPPWIGKGGDGGEQVGIAKKLGFTYEKIYGDERINIPKTWVTRVKERNYSGLLDSIASSPSPFRVDKIEGLTL